MKCVMKEAFFVGILTVIVGTLITYCSKVKVSHNHNAKIGIKIM